MTSDSPISVLWIKCKWPRHQRHLLLKRRITYDRSQLYWIQTARMLPKDSMPHHPHLCLDRLCFDQINLHFLFSGPGSPNESDFRRWIQTAKIKRNHSSPNFPSNVMGNCRFCLQRSQLRSARCAITIWILRKASQVVSQNYRWHLCAQMLSWLQFQSGLASI